MIVWRNKHDIGLDDDNGDNSPIMDYISAVSDRKLL